MNGFGHIASEQAYKAWIARLAAWWQQRFFRWLDHKIPKSDSYRLGLKNLYIFPTRTGFVFLLFIIVLWMLGSNYQNNLILIICYLMISVFIICIYHTHANLSGMCVKAVSAKPVFAGEYATFPVILSSSLKGGNHGLTARWQKGESVAIELVNGSIEQVLVTAKTIERGRYQPGRLLIETVFPLGIMRCWCWLNFEIDALVYPTPKAISEPQVTSGQQEGAEAKQITLSGDDFFGLRSYQAGDSLKQVAWKHFAKEKGLYSKNYQQALASEKILSWESLRYLPVEERISALCYLCLYYSQQEIPFGLELPGHKLPVSSSKSHTEKVLSLLALLPKTIS